MDKMGKILDKNNTAIVRELKSQGKKIVLCHGVFDIVHPGHIIHFEEAKKLGDVLIVSITSEKYVRKGPGRPYFNDEMRLRQLSAISCIDYVMVSEGYTVQDIVEAVEPDIYVKGREYANPDDDITGKIDEETELVRKHGGEIAYTDGMVFSSTRLINHAFPALSDEAKEYLEVFCSKVSIQDIRELADRMRQLKVLVVGDAIIDEYIFCSVQGLMSKDMGYSARFHETETYLGGTLAVARHLASFCDNVTLMTIVGNEEAIHSRILDAMGSEMRLDLTYSSEFKTIVKSRYVSVNEKREEVHKIFGINNLLEPMWIDKESKEQFCDKLEKCITDYDLVVLSDFGHGLVDNKVMSILQEKANVLSVNCQTNSSNYGKNLITKYHRADFFALDQKELSLAFSDYGQKEEEAIVRLARHLNGKGWLTRGSFGATGVDDGELFPCPAFSLKVKDTIGAGDAFYAVSSLAAAAGATIEVGTFMGNIAGALAANIVGNKEAVEKVNVLKYASTLLNM